MLQITTPARVIGEPLRNLTKGSRPNNLLHSLTRLFSLCTYFLFTFFERCEPNGTQIYYENLGTLRIMIGYHHLMSLLLRLCSLGNNQSPSTCWILDWNCRLAIFPFINPFMIGYTWLVIELFLLYKLSKNMGRVGPMTFRNWYNKHAVKTIKFETQCGLFNWFSTKKFLE